MSLNSPQDSDFSDLDNLLSESLSLSREAKEAKEARLRRKAGWQTPAEKAEDDARLHRWEMANEWKAVANVGLFHRYTCTCGASHTIFEGIMHRQEHRHMKFSMRWQAAEASLAALPTETAVRVTAVPVCSSCAASRGFDLAKATVWE